MKWDAVFVFFVLITKSFLMDYSKKKLIKKKKKWSKIYKYMNK